MLTIRRRGRAGKWYVRGSVTLGERSIDVAEFSTGTTDEDAARHLMTERERCLREELMFGPRVVLTRATISDVFEAVLRPIWLERGRPGAGHVFLNRRGAPYTDTRDLKVQGGNPLQTAHENARRRAGIADFTVHDWRHHLASHCVMVGIDLITIMRLDR